ncbi:MAG: putative peptidase and in, kexin, sedolisin precursor [Verrucomicrobiales bacterium]|nr:putative peptidase and in, kexin, sedolisin precursor [Verrucomicrobiales bacterium]
MTAISFLVPWAIGARKNGIRLTLLAALSLFFITPSFAQMAPDPAGAEAAPGELIVKFRENATDAQLAHALRVGNMKILRHIQTEAMRSRGHIGLTHVATGLRVNEALAQLKNHPAIDYVEPNYIYTHQTASNDPYLTGGNLWGMDGDLSSPANGYGSQAAEAWANGYTGSKSIYVGIIDEGIQISHPDLAPNIWQNPFEGADGVDNDSNGYVDDIHGWNFAGNNNQVFDPAGDQHGTHVAGTIGGKGGNGVGVAGVNWDVNIISAKFMSGGSGSTLAAVQAIDYLVALKQRHGLNIVAINASWGGTGYSQSLHDSIIRAAKAGILLIAAAGNGDSSGNGLNNDAVAFYPANIDTRIGTSTESAATYDSVISVAAIDQSGAKAAFSNYGATKVHLGAPGVAIYSTLPTDTYGAYSGTSMATPHVTGAAALYASTHPGATAQQIRDAILGSVIPTPSLAGITATGGRLNLSNIITPTAQPAPPATPSAPAGVSATAGLSKVSGTAPVSIKWNASSGATSYTVKRATSSTGTFSAVASGITSLTYTDNVTANGGTYYYIVTALNSAGSSQNSVTVSTIAQPPAPQNLVASALSSTQLNLAWQDKSADEQGYVIQYSLDALNWYSLGTVLTGTTSVTVSGTTSLRTYYFRVRAYNGSLYSGYSNAVKITMP